MKRIILVHLMDPLRPAKGGAIRYTQNLLKHLLRRSRFAVEVWGVQDPGNHPIDNDVYAALKKGRLRIKYVSVGGDMLSYLIRLFLYVARTELNNSIIHVQREVFALPFLFMRWKTRGSHLVLTLHAEPLETLRRESPLLYVLAMPLYTVFMRLVFASSSAVIVVSRSLINYVSRLGGLGKLRNKIVVIPVGIDTDLFRPPTQQEKNALRDKYGIGRDDFVILFVGRFEAVKRPELFVKAIKHLISMDHSKNIKALMVGDGSLFNKVKELIRRLGLEEHIMLVGSVTPDKVPEFYRMSDLLCLTSSTEASPNVIKEALSSGIPFVATAVSDEITWLSSLGVGRAVPKDVDPKELAKSMLDFMNNEIRDPSLATRCREVGKLLDANRVYGLVEKVYKLLLVDSKN